MTLEATAALSATCQALRERGDADDATKLLQVLFRFGDNQRRFLHNAIDEAADHAMLDEHRPTSS